MIFSFVTPAKAGVHVLPTSRPGRGCPRRGLLK
jgi:hypothetical protein